MDIEKINPEYMGLIDKLYTAQQIYTMAAERATTRLLKDQMQEMASGKEVYIKEIAHLYDLDPPEYQKILKERVNVELDKVKIEINHLLLDDKEQLLFDYCINREKEINQIYKRILSREDYTDLEHTLIKSQLRQNQQHISELSKTNRGVV